MLNTSFPSVSLAFWYVLRRGCLHDHDQAPLKTLDWKVQASLPRKHFRPWHYNVLQKRSASLLLCWERNLASLGLVSSGLCPMRVSLCWFCFVSLCKVVTYTRYAPSHWLSVTSFVSKCLGFTWLARKTQHPSFWLSFYIPICNTLCNSNRSVSKQPHKFKNFLPQVPHLSFTDVYRRSLDSLTITGHLIFAKCYIGAFTKLLWCGPSGNFINSTSQICQVCKHMARLQESSLGSAVPTQPHRVVGHQRALAKIQPLQMLEHGQPRGVFKPSTHLLVAGKV